MQYIFDTNYYRTFIYSKSKEEIRTEIEKQKNLEEYTVIFPNIVAIELINHLETGDPARTNCLHSLFLLFRHASTIVNGRYKGIGVSTIHDLLTNYFFDKVSNNFSYVNRAVFGLTHHLYENNGDTAEVEEYIQKIINFKREEIKSMIDNLEKHYLPSFTNDNSVNWNVFRENDSLKLDFREQIKNKTIHKLFGLSLLKMAENEVEQQSLSEVSNDFFTNKFLKDFEVSIDFFVEKILKKLVEIENMEYFYKPETDTKKRWNSFYDFQLIFATEFEVSKGRKTVFVTNEKQIRNHFKKYNKEQYVMSPKEYNEKISAK